MHRPVRFLTAVSPQPRHPGSRADPRVFLDISVFLPAPYRQIIVFLDRMRSVISFLKATGRLFLALLFLGLGPVAGHPLSPPLLTGQRVALAPYFSIFQDSTGLL